jgi:hypothetical protein
LERLPNPLNLQADKSKELLLQGNAMKTKPLAKPLTKAQKDQVAPKQTTIVRSSPGGGYPEEGPNQGKAPVIPPEKQSDEKCDPKTQRCETTLGNPVPKEGDQEKGDQEKGNQEKQS